MFTQRIKVYFSLRRSQNKSNIVANHTIRKIAKTILTAALTLLTITIV